MFTKLPSVFHSIAFSLKQTRRTSCRQCLPDQQPTLSVSLSQGRLSMWLPRLPPFVAFRWKMCSRPTEGTLRRCTALPWGVNRESRRGDLPNLPHFKNAHSIWRRLLFHPWRTKGESTFFSFELNMWNNENIQDILNHSSWYNQCSIIRRSYPATGLQFSPRWTSLLIPFSSAQIGAFLALSVISKSQDVALHLSLTVFNIAYSNRWGCKLNLLPAVSTYLHLQPFKNL